MKTTGAVSCVWDHFSIYDPKYNFVALYRTVYVFGTLDLDRTRTWTSLQDYATFDATALSAANCLLQHFGRFGSPHQLRSDNGPHFIADVKIGRAHV